MAFSLYLFPSESEATPTTSSDLRDHLSDIDLVRKNGNLDILPPGERLMEYINFLGCSPTLQSGQLECQVRIHVYNKVTALGGESVESLRYPECRHIITDPQRLLHRAFSQPNWVCSECGNSGNIKEINWRKSAGFSRLFIEISSIFPKEALPNDKLLALLHQFNQTSWSWFYSKSSF